MTRIIPSALIFFLTVSLIPVVGSGCGEESRQSNTTKVKKIDLTDDADSVEDIQSTPTLDQHKLEEQFSRLPDIGHPFDVEKYGSLEITDQDNAFVIYREAVAKIKELPKDEQDNLEPVLKPLEDSEQAAELPEPFE